MIRLWAISTVLFAALTLAAWDGALIPTLACNIEDQLLYVPSHRPLHYPSVDKVESGQPYSLESIILLKEKTDRVIKIRGSLTVTDPDGKKKEIFKDIELIDIPSGSQGVFSAEMHIRAEFENGDPEGRYVYTLLLKDSEGNEKAVVSAVTLVGSIIDPKPMTSEEFDSFFNNYYRNPQPERLLAAWQYYISEAVVKQQEREGDSFDPMALLNGFSEAFRLNPQFYDEFAALSKKAPVADHAFYAAVFAGQGKNVAAKYKDVMNPELLPYIERFGENLFEFDRVEDGAQLDMLWLEFFVTGKFEPVRRIAAELRQRPEISMDEAKKRNSENKPLNKEEIEKFMNFVLRSAAAWSLRSNLEQQHFLLGYYLETIAAKKLYEDDQELALIAAIFKMGNSKQEDKK